jgi:hypothetical protein
MELNEIKSLLHNQRNCSKLKSVPIEWGKIFAISKPDMRLVTRIYRELKNLNSPQIDDPMKK